MKTEKGASQSHRGIEGNLRVCAIAAVLSCLLMLIWALIPVFTGAGSLDPSTLTRRVLIPIGFVLLNVAGVLLTSSIVAAMFAQSNWRRGRVAVGPSLIGVLLFGAQALAMWRLAVAQNPALRTDPVVWVLTGVAVAFVSTWLLLEPLLRLPAETSDCARLDGLGFGGFYWHMMLPHMKARVLVASILPFAAGLS
nr:hypothetical protein [Chthoniobacterales bacterium]